MTSLLVDEALHHFQEAIRLRPNWAEGHASVGTGLFMQGRVEEAVGHFRRALEIEPSHVRAREGLNAALAQGESPPPPGL